MEEGTKPLKMEHNFCRNPQQGLVLIGSSSVSHDPLREQLEQTCSVTDIFATPPKLSFGFDGGAQNRF